MPLESSPRMCAGSLRRALLASATIAAFGAPLPAQQNPLLDKIASTDIRASSLSALDLIASDARQVDGDIRAKYRQIASDRIAAAADALRTASPDLAKALQRDFTDAVRQAQEQNEKYELLLKIRKHGILASTDLVVKGAEAIGSFIPGPYAKLGVAITAPFAQQAVELWADNQVEEGIQANEARLGTIVRDRFATFVAAGNVLPSDQQLKTVFETLLGDELGRTATDRSILNREALRFTGEYLRKHDQEIRTLANQLAAQEGAIAEVQARTTAELKQFRKDIEGFVESRVSTLANGLATLADQQIKGTAALERLQGRVEVNETRIKNLEEQAKNTAISVSNLQSITAEHGRLIAQNRAHIDMLSAYTFNGLSLKQKIAALDNGDFDHIFTGQEKEKLRSDLGTASTLETINDAVNAGAQVADLLVQTGVLKGNDAKVVGTAIEVIGNVVGIGTAIYTGNPVGAITGVVNLVRLGLGAKPEPSPEMRMLQRVDAKLDQLQQSIIIVDKKLDYLIEFTQRGFERQSIELANHSAMVAKRFDRIDWKLDYVIRIGNTLLGADVRKCGKRGQNGPIPTTFTGFAERYQSDAGFFLEDCLRGLRNVANDLGPFAAVYYEKYANPASPAEADQLEFEIRTLYEPAVELFCRFFGLDLSPAERALDAKQAVATCLHPTARGRTPTLALAVNELVVPAKSLGSRTAIRDTIRSTQGSEFVDPTVALGAMLSPVAIDSISSALVDLTTYFEIASGGATYQPFASAQEFLALSDVARRNRRNNITTMLASSIRFVNYGLAQQVLLSGAPLIHRMRHVLHTDGATTREKAITRDLLRLNPYFAFNFAVAILQETFGVSATGVPRVCAEAPSEPCLRRFQTLYATIADSSATDAEVQTTLAELNDATRASGLSFTLSGRVLQMSHPAWSENPDQPLALIVPSPDWLTRNELLYPESVYALLALKQKVAAALVSVSLPAGFGQLSSKLTLDHYRWLIVQ